MDDIYNQLFKQNYKYYSVLDVLVMSKINDNNNKCFGFVIFDNNYIIDEIIDNNNIFIKERKLRLTRYNNKIKETTNYVKIGRAHV